MNRALSFLKAVAGLSIIGGIVLRAFHLALPNKLVFDEVYFPVMANDFLHGKVTFDAHPPLGKFLIAGGIKLFGFTAFGYRIVPFVFGVALIGLLWTLGRRYFSRNGEEGNDSQVAGLILASLASLECLLILYSRLGLMDGIMLFFIMAAFLHSLRAKSPLGWLMLGVMIGACAAIKWPAAAVLAPIAYIAWRRKALSMLIAVLPVSFVVYALVVVAGGWIGGEKDLWAYFTWWHQSVWGYETTLHATHPWSSQWYSWPLMLRPVLMLRDAAPAGGTYIIDAIGNPIIWYASTVAVVLSVSELIRVKFSLKQAIADHPLVPLPIGWAASYLIWVPVTRILFIYTYIPAYGFALLMLTYWLVTLWRSKPWLVVLFIALALGLTAFYFPIVIGWPALSDPAINSRIWLPSWI